MINFIKNIFKRKPDFKHWLKIGDKVISKSNEPDMYNIGYITGFYERSTKTQKDFPIIRHIDDNEEYVTLWAYEPYSETVVEILNKLTPMEQWVYMLKGSRWWIAYEKEVDWYFYWAGYKYSDWKVRTYEKICTDLWINN